MRILFICPPNYRFRQVSFHDFGLGPAYLAAVLQNQHDVAFYEADAPTEEETRNVQHDYTSYEFLGRSHTRYLEGLQDESHFIWKEVKEVIRKYAPDVIGLSSMTPSFPSALVVARLAREVSDATIIFGGVHATILPEDAIKDPNVDYVVRGEGEETIVELIQCLEKKGDPGQVKGITYRKAGELVHTPDRPLISNLDTIPFPRRDSLLFPERFSKRNYVNMLAGRGCPHNCHFCANPVLWKRKYRLRSAQNVLEELRILCRDYGENILFWDDNLLVSPKMLLEFCSAIKSEIPDLLWRCQSRVDTISPERLTAMKESGCWDVKLGLESGSNRILSYINKDLDTRRIMGCAEMIQKSGLQFSVNFMFGFPEETWEDLQATLEMVKQIPANSIAVSKFIPLPGTKLFQDVISLGLIPDAQPRYEYFDLYSTHYHYSKHISREKFQEFYAEIHRVVEEKNRRTRIGAPKRASGNVPPPN